MVPHPRGDVVAVLDRHGACSGQRLEVADEGQRQSPGEQRPAVGPVDVGEPDREQPGRRLTGACDANAREVEAVDCRDRQRHHDRGLGLTMPIEKGEGRRVRSSGFRAQRLRADEA